MPSATPDVTTQGDVEMHDANTGSVIEVPAEEVDATKIKILPGATEDAASFEFTNEDHTLGNSLRYIIMKNPKVEFCGYSIPHPSEPKMNVRIQTYKPYTPREALRKGLDDLVDMCETIEDKFVDAKEAFDKKEAEKANDNMTA